MDATQPDPARAFLGVGWAFPPRLEPDGRVAEAVHEEDVRQAVAIILGTAPGERVMRPDFGAGLDRFVFEPIDTATLARVQTRVREALVTWEPRIDVQDVQVTTRADQPSTLLVELTYRVRATNTLENLVYPFYLEEGSAR
jgi:phage baseplate assembly protein W